MTLTAAISSDIDTLESIYKGQGCRRAGGYTYAEFEIGLENFARFLEDYDAPATLFMVGQDFEREKHHALIRDMVSGGHEIANHTHTHTQGFGHLPPQAMEQEVARMESACEAVTGRRPVGFRSPGWNVSDRALPILKRRGYHYDSSVFPTSLMPLLKFMHWYTMSDRGRLDRTTMGQWNYMLSPVQPYHAAHDSLAKTGAGGIYVFPVTVTPVLRIPFFATFLLSTGLRLFEWSYRWLKQRGYMIQFQFHLSDFVDYTTPHFADQVPQPGTGQYVPKALVTPLPEKMALFRAVMDTLAADYRFSTLADLVPAENHPAQKKSPDW